MYNSSTIFSQRKASKASNTQKLKAFANKVKPGLAVDTSVSRHRGQAPQQVFPYESITEEHGLGIQRLGGLQGNLGNFAPAVHKRVKGLKPTPLNLQIAKSPPCRIKPSGIALSSVPKAQDSDSYSRVDVAFKHSPLLTQQGLHSDAITPTIIVTPARDEFDESLKSEDLKCYRPASSVYSRYTNGLSMGHHDTKTPPVPPLPLFADPGHLKASLQDSRASATTVLQGADRHKSRDVALSVCTVFEEDSALTPTARSISYSASIRQPKRLTRQSHLPTPMRSKGWWNVLTSPFSAGSNVFHWRSPTLDEEHETARTPLMNEASAMGFTNPLFGRIFNGRRGDDDELHTAPPEHHDNSFLPKENNGRTVPKRSLTAPSVLDSNTPSVNIYRIPSQGEAAAYYDKSRNFPSVMLTFEGDNLPRSMFSPDTDVHEDHEDLKREIDDLEEEAALKSAVKDEDLEARLRDLEARLVEMERRKEQKAVVPASPAASASELADPVTEFDAYSAGSASGIQSTQPNNISTPGTLPEGGAARPLSPVEDTHASYAETPFTAADRAVFASPSTEEMATPRPRPMPERQVTTASAMSPLSATPILANAHFAHFVGPESVNGEQREIAITSARTPPSATDRLGLGAATMASRDADRPATAHSHLTFNEKQGRWQRSHSREDSTGLGIRQSHTSSESELFPPPKPLSEKVTLGTDRFRQLTVRSLDEPERPAVAWYRRFFWMLVSAATLLLLLMVVLLVIFVPQRHNDTPVQAQWLNLTGFPALPTGVATVVQPRVVKEADQCIQPSALWSCSASAQSAVSSGSTPNFRFDIRFRNGTTLNDTAVLPTSSTIKRRSGLVAVAGAVARNKLVQARDEWTSYLYYASPSPPSEDDQNFLGQTTDSISVPYNGEDTPYYLSLLDAEALVGSKLRKRGEDLVFQYPYPISGNGGTETSSSSTTVSAETSTSSGAANSIMSPYPYPTSDQQSAYTAPTSITLAATSSISVSTTSTQIEGPPQSTTGTSFNNVLSSTSGSSSASSTSIPSSTSKPFAGNSASTGAPTKIPKPSLGTNGKPASSQLYPLAESQPLRLYNRGQDDEHYGFYTYFDRTLYASNFGGDGNGSDPNTKADVALNDASVVCTWSQTRLRVQIWTQRGTTGELATTGASTSIAAINSTANDMTAPGSFPYPVTVTIDRHGGDAERKGLYCYGINQEQHIVDDAKMWIDEDRGVDGSLINPAQVPSSNGTSWTRRDISDAIGGIDGGTGGCSCQYSTLG